MVLWLDHIWSVVFPSEPERPALMAYWLLAGGCLVVGFVVGWACRNLVRRP